MISFSNFIYCNYFLCETYANIYLIHFPMKSFTQFFHIFLSSLVNRVKFVCMNSLRLLRSHFRFRNGNGCCNILCKYAILYVRNM